MFTQEQEAGIVELYNNGFSPRYIARKLRVNRQAVKGYITALDEVETVETLAETDPEILDALNNHGQDEVKVEYHVPVPEHVGETVVGILPTE